MNTRTSVALGIGVGYVLGRTHKLRWATMLGAAAATGGLNGIGGQVLEKGADFMRSTPELSKLADGGQRLLEAGRGAAMSAMNSRMGSMEESLKGRTEQLGRVAGGDGGKQGGRGRGGQRDDEDYDEEARDERDEEEPDEDEEERDDDERDEDERDDYDEEDEEDEEEEEPEPEPEPARAGQRGGGRQGRSGSGGRGGRRNARTGDGA